MRSLVTHLALQRRASSSIRAVLWAITLTSAVMLCAGCNTIGSSHRAPCIGSPEVGRPWTIPWCSAPFLWDADLECWVAQFETTNELYWHFRAEQRRDLLAQSRRVLGNEKYRDHIVRGSHPVVGLTYEEALAFAAWLTLREGDAGRLPVGWVYRLPTSDEWVGFASAGGKYEYPWGNDPVVPPSWNYADGEAIAWFPGDESSPHCDGHALTAPVAESGKNPAGLFGVGGNVWEMTTELWGTGYRIARGGSWRTGNIKRLDCESQMPFAPGSVSLDIGFRLVLAPWRQDTGGWTDPARSGESN